MITGQLLSQAIIKHLHMFIKHFKYGASRVDFKTPQHHMAKQYGNIE